MSKKDFQSINIGLVGLGTVGTGVAKILIQEADFIRQSAGVSLVLKKVCVKSLSKKRNISLPAGTLTTNPDDIINDKSIDIVVELIGGIHKAKQIILRSFQEGKHVVTANKALLAEDAEAVFEASEYYSRRLGFEASVCGGIPIIRSMRQGLASNHISHFFGIVNGTCNYILTKMSQEGSDFSLALKEAQAKGYAETDPTLDIEGQDSAHKLAILARLAFAAKIDYKSIHVEGITKISAADIEYAKELGYTIKLLAIAKKKKEGLELRVQPTMLPLDHPLANVRGVYNAVYVNADQVQDILFYGRGAGMMPTASAVMSDIIEIAKGIKLYGNPNHCDLPVQLENPKILQAKDIVSKYYLHFQVADKPGVLGSIAQTLGKNKISILSVNQKESHDPKSAPVIILTYEARESDIQKALKKIDGSGFASQKTAVIRVEK